MLKVIVLSALVALAVADKPDPYNVPEPIYRPAPPPPPPAYKAAPPPAPAPYKPAPGPYKEEPEPAPQPYSYKYGVSDSYTGADFDKAEEQDGYGNLQGEYRVQLPDGRTQIVRYKADQNNGFVADVSYEGVAQYPPEPKEGYGKAYPAVAVAVAPKYKPAPAPYDA